MGIVFHQSISASQMKAYKNVPIIKISARFYITLDLATWSSLSNLNLACFTQITVFVINIENQVYVKIALY